MKITRFQIEDFRGHASLDLPLTDLTVLVGRNNVGKSAVIQAMLLLSRAVRFAPLSAPESGFNSFRAMSRNGGSGSIRLAVELDRSISDSADVKPVRYEISLGPPSDSLGRVEITQERLAVGSQEYFSRDHGALGGSIWIALSSIPDIQKLITNSSALATMTKLRGGPVEFHDSSVSKARHILRTIGHYRLIPYRVSEPGTAPEDADEAEQASIAPLFVPNVETNGSRTVELLALLKAHHPDRLAGIVASLSQAIDGLVDLEFRASVDDADTVDLIAIFRDDRGEVPASQLSDGTRSLLGLLTILASPRWFPLVCFEEPEIGLTAQATSVFATELCRSLQDSSRHQQVMISTHSPFLLEALHTYVRNTAGPAIGATTLVLSKDSETGASALCTAQDAVDVDRDLGPNVRTLDAIDWADLLRRL